MGFFDSVRSALSLRSSAAPAPTSTPEAAPALPASTSTSSGTAERRMSGGKPPVVKLLEAPHALTTLVTYRALDARPQDWFNVMQRADQGDTAAMIEMFNDARDRDGHLDGVARKRSQSMVGRPITFRVPDGYEEDPEAHRAVAATRRALLCDSRGFKKALQHLMQAPVDGWAVCETFWRTNREGWWIPHLEPVLTVNTAFQLGTLKPGYYADHNRIHTSVIPFEEHPDKFVVHIPITGRSDYPWRRGAMRSCIIPSFVKRNGIKFWMTLAERFGMPQPFAKVPRGVDHDGKPTDDLFAEAEKAMQNLGRVWSMVVSNTIEIDSIPGSGNVRGEVHQKLIEWANTTQSVAMLGQNLTTVVQGGSFAAAESHRWVAGDLHLADATELADSLTEQVVEPFIRYNLPGAPVPIAEISTAQKQVFTENDVLHGTASRDERRRTLGHDAIPDGKGADYERTTSVQVPGYVPPPDGPSTEPTDPEDEGEPEDEEGSERSWPHAV